ncbi:MAG: hypothetical protein V1909_02625 [Candidatus Micrarchaeota archaeon]
MTKLCVKQKTKFKQELIEKQPRIANMRPVTKTIGAPEIAPELMRRLEMRAPEAIEEVCAQLRALGYPEHVELSIGPFYGGGRRAKYSRRMRRPKEGMPTWLVVEL